MPDTMGGALIGKIDCPRVVFGFDSTRRIA
jgi:hypothetical protein